MRLNKEMLIFVLLSALLTLTRCGGGHNTGTGSPAVVDQTVQADYFPFSDQSFTMADSTGGHTFMQLVPVPAGSECTRDKMIGLKMTKDTVSAYWAPGTPGAGNVTVIAKAKDGSIRLAGGPQWADSGGWITPGDTTVQVVSGAGYALLPSTSQQSVVEGGQTVTLSGVFNLWFQPNTNDFNCAINAPGASVPNGFSNRAWQVRWRMAEVNTEAFSGLALAADYIEAGGNRNGQVSETWYFAPDLGLVEIDFYSYQPPYALANVLKRIN